MSSQPIVINIGALPNDGTGDPLRTAFNDVNLNFANVFAYGPVLSNIQIANNTILTTNTNGNLILNPNGIGVVQANAHVVPDSTRIRNLGSPSLYWDSAYVWYGNFQNATIGTATIGNIGNLTIPVGNIHILGGTNGYVLQTDGTGNLTWTAQTGGMGNGVPGGANTQVQYNDAGAFGGTAGFTFDNTSNVLSVPGNVSAGNVLTSAQVIANGEIQSGTGFFTGGYLSVNGNTDLHDTTVTGNLIINNSGPEWSFNTDGSLSLPAGNLVGLGNVIGPGNISYPFGPGPVLLANTAGNNSAYFSLTAVANATGVLGYMGMAQFGSNTSTGLVETNDDTGVTHDWYFNPDGTTAFPAYTFPNVDGANTQVLTTDGSGTLSWSNVASSGGAAGNAGDIQINVAGNIGADSTLRYVDNGGEMTLYADYLNAPGIFTSDIYAGDGTPSNITLTTSYGNAAWTFGSDGYLTMPLVTRLNSGGVGNPNSAEFGTEVTVMLPSQSVTGSQIYMGAGTTEIRGIVDAAGAGLMYAGVEGEGFAGIVGMDPGVTSQYAIAVGTNNTILLGATTGNGELTTTEYTAGVGALNSNGTINGLLASSSNVVISNGNTAGWSFGADGNLVLPGGIVDGLPQAAIIINQVGGPGLWTQGGTATPSLNYSDFSNIIVSSDIYVTTDSGSKQWTFGADGNLTLPAGSTINNANGDVIVNTINPNISVNAILNASYGLSAGTYINQPTTALTGTGTGMTVNYTVLAGNDGIDSVSIYTPGLGYADGDQITIPVGIPVSGAIFDIAVGAPSTETWTFGQTGELYTPQGGRLGSAGKGWTGLDGGYGNPVSLTSYYANGFYAGCVTNGSDGTINISTYTGNGLQGSWTFDNTGTLNVGGNIISGNLGNPMYITGSTANADNRAGSLILSGGSAINGIGGLPSAGGTLVLNGGSATGCATVGGSVLINAGAGDGDFGNITLTVNSKSTLLNEAGQAILPAVKIGTENSYDPGNPYEGEQLGLYGTRRIISPNSGGTNQVTMSTIIQSPQFGSPQVVYTAYNANVWAFKMTMRIQHGAGAPPTSQNMQMADIFAARNDAGVVTYSVTNRLNTDPTEDDVVIVPDYDPIYGTMFINATVTNSGTAANGSYYFTFDVAEFNQTYD